jgi:hypothetical protein
MFTFILFTFIFICYGISNIVVFSTGPWHMFEKWRALSTRISPSFGEMFQCMMCFPFWAGVILSAINLFLFNDLIFTPCNLLFYGVQTTIWNSLLIMLLDGAISSGTVWILHNIEESFEK